MTTLEAYNRWNEIRHLMTPQRLAASAAIHDEVHVLCGVLAQAVRRGELAIEAL